MEIYIRINNYFMINTAIKTNNIGVRLPKRKKKEMQATGSVNLESLSALLLIIFHFCLESLLDSCYPDPDSVD